MRDYVSDNHGATGTYQTRHDSCHLPLITRIVTGKDTVLIISLLIFLQSRFSLGFRCHVCLGEVTDPGDRTRALSNFNLFRCQFENLCGVGSCREPPANQLVMRSSSRTRKSTSQDVQGSEGRSESGVNMIASSHVPARREPSGNKKPHDFAAARIFVK